MNPEGDNKLPSEKKANENNDDEHQKLDQSMSDDEETNKSPTDLSLRQRQQQLSASIPQSTNSSRTNQTSEMVRSAAKDLIERYFYQLQRGCGNPKCTNVNCASSGELAPMTANEMAARAIQLLSLDAKLCDDYSQPSKVPRTDSHYDSPTSSSHVNHHTPLPIAEDVNTYNQQLDHSSAGSTSNSAITSSPYTSTHSTSSTGSSNTNISSCSTEEMPLIVALDENTTVKQSVANTVQQETNSLTNSSWETSDSPRPTFEPVEYLNEQILDDMIEKCKKQNNYDLLVHAISEVFPSIQKLSKSFRRRRPLVKMTSTATASKLQEILGKSPQELKKEDLRTLEGEHDKDEDSSYSCLQKPLQIRGLDLNNDHASFYSSQRFNSLPRAVSRNSGDVGGDGDGYGAVIEPMDEDCTFDDTVDRAQSSHTMVDVESLGRVKRKLHDVKEVSVAEALNDNIILFSDNVGNSHDWEKVLHCFVVCFDMLLETRYHYADLEHLEGTLHRLCMVIRQLPVMTQARLARIWSTHYKDQLHSIVYLLQQIISLKIILEEEELEDYYDVMSLTQALKIAYYANILAGEIDTYDNQQENNAASSSARDDDDIFNYKRIEHVYHDELETALGVSRIDGSVPFIPYEEFYNEPLSDYIQMDKDYLIKMILNYTRESYFSFMFHSFILTPATKVIALYYDSRVRMFSEQATIQAIMNYVDGNDGRVLPNLKLKVRRDNIQPNYVNPHGIFPF